MKCGWVGTYIPPPLFQTMGSLEVYPIVNFRILKLVVVRRSWLKHPVIQNKKNKQGEY